MPAAMRIGRVVHEAGYRLLKMPGVPAGCLERLLAVRLDARTRVGSRIRRLAAAVGDQIHLGVRRLAAVDRRQRHRAEGGGECVTGRVEAEFARGRPSLLRLDRGGCQRQQPVGLRLEPLAGLQFGLRPERLQPGPGEEVPLLGLGHRILRDLCLQAESRFHPFDKAPRRASSAHAPDGPQFVDDDFRPDHPFGQAVHLAQQSKAGGRRRIGLPRQSGLSGVEASAEVGQVGMRVVLHLFRRVPVRHRVQGVGAAAVDVLMAVKELAHGLAARAVEAREVVLQQLVHVGVDVPRQLVQDILAGTVVKPDLREGLEPSATEPEGLIGFAPGVGHDVRIMARHDVTAAVQVVIEAERGGSRLAPGAHGRQPVAGAIGDLHMNAGLEPDAAGHLARTAVGDESHRLVGKFLAQKLGHGVVKGNVRIGIFFLQAQAAWTLTVTQAVIDPHRHAQLVGILGEIIPRIRHGDCRQVGVAHARLPRALQRIGRHKALAVDHRVVFRMGFAVCRGREDVHEPMCGVLRHVTGAGKRRIAAVHAGVVVGDERRLLAHVEARRQRERVAARRHLAQRTGHEVAVAAEPLHEIVHGVAGAQRSAARQHQMRGVGHQQAISRRM